MSAWKPFSRPSNDPIKSLVLIFVLWKFVLVLLAVASPVPGYDTSSLILIKGPHLRASHRNFHSEFCTMRERLAINLVRWDAIYFVKTAERGYVNEQEWAFSWVFTRLIAFVASCMVFSYGMLICIAELAHRFSISRARSRILYMGRNFYFSYVSPFISAGITSPLYRGKKWDTKQQDSLRGSSFAHHFASWSVPICALRWIHFLVTQLLRDATLRQLSQGSTRS